MALSDIKRALYTQLASIVGLPVIHYPNIDGSDSVSDETFIVPSVLPATTTPVDLVATDNEIGIFQVLIYVKKGVGELAASDIGQLILDGFPRNLNLSDVRINRIGTINTDYFDGSRQVTPVSITYQNIS